jgi:hypothetical protein
MVGLLLSPYQPGQLSGSPPERRAAAEPDEELRDDCWCWTHLRKERRLSWRWEAMEREEESSEIGSGRKGPPLQRAMSRGHLPPSGQWMRQERRESS